MFKKFKKSFALVLLAAFSLFMVACSDDGDTDTDTDSADQGNDEELTVGVSIATLRHQFFIDIEKGMKTVADEEGVKLLVNDGDLDISKQMSAMEDFIQQDVDSIVIYPSETTGLVPVTEQAVDAGIPVITGDATIETPKITTFVGTENYDAGFQLGEDLLGRLEGEEEIEIALVTYPESSVQAERLDGFKDAFEGQDNVSFLNEQPGYDREESMAAVENIMQSNPDVDYIYATAENSVLGALAALETANNEETKIVGFDVTEEAAEGIRKGYIVSMVQQQPEVLGEEAMKAAIAAVRGEEVDERIEIPIMLIDADNVDEEF